MFEGVSSPEQLSLLCHAYWSQCWEGASSLRVGGKGFFEVHSCRTERLEARSLLLPEPVLPAMKAFAAGCSRAFPKVRPR